MTALPADDQGAHVKFSDGIDGSIAAKMNNAVADRASRQHVRSDAKNRAARFAEKTHPAMRYSMAAIHLPVENATATCAFLVAIFESVLQISPIGPDDDFFELGGDSITAITLAVEVEKATGVQLPTTALFDAPTPARLARIIEKPARSPDPCLVLLKPGIGTPVFMAHGVGGGVMDLVPLARLLDTPNPVYGIEATGLDGKAAPLDTIEAMAELYLKSIRGVQPHGPYCLIGYSMGGLTAFDLARLLAADGEKTALLALLDTAIHPDSLVLGQWIHIWVRRAGHHAAILRKRRWRAAIPYALRRVRGFLNDFRPMHPSLQRVGDERLPAPARRVIESGRRAAARYRPHFYPGTITFIQAAANLDAPSYPEICWRPLAQELIVHVVRGDHWNMIGAHVESVASVLSRCVQHAMSRTGL